MNVCSYNRCRCNTVKRFWALVYVIMFMDMCVFFGGFSRLS